MKVFISYRRLDSQVTAGRIAQFLDAVPAVREVFLDVDDIELGENFEQRIQSTLTHASHVFVLIGSQWRGFLGETHPARIFDDEDVVRQETRLALRSGLRVVPILIDDAHMPQASELPEDIKELSKINAFALRTSHFDEDMDSLLDVLVGNRKGRGSRWHSAPLTPKAIAVRAIGGLFAAGVLLIVLGVANRYLSSDCYDLTCTLKVSLGIADETDARALLWLLAIGTLVLGVLVPFIPRLTRRRR
jgi:hypothetical protein